MKAGEYIVVSKDVFNTLVNAAPESMEIETLPLVTIMDKAFEMGKNVTVSAYGMKSNGMNTTAYTTLKNTYLNSELKV